MEYSFIAKKVIQAFLLPPGLLVLILGIILFNIRNIRGLSKTRWLLAATLIMVYALSIKPVYYMLLQPLEYYHDFPRELAGDVVVTLGGGSTSGTPDFQGRGSLGGSSSARFITAVRAQRMTGADLMITSGAVLGVKSAECETFERYAIALGVPREKIVLDNNAQDTGDNARNTLEICKKYGWKRIILVTSASHIPRAFALLKAAAGQAGYPVDITCLPAGYLSPKPYKFVWADLLPDDIQPSQMAIHEYVGLAANYFGIK